MVANLADQKKGSRGLLHTKVGQVNDRTATRAFRDLNREVNQGETLDIIVKYGDDNSLCEILGRWMPSHGDPTPTGFYD